jgi:hypothetical protein
MNTPDPVPASSRPPLIDRSSVASLTGGAPLAIATVWAVQTFGMKPGSQIDPTVACALGSVGATVFGEAWKAFTAVLDRWVNR